MKNIEIITTQNVVLQYELASLRDRIVAFALDATFIIISFSILSALMSSIFGGSTTSGKVARLFLTCLVCVYSLAFEFLNNGRSIGKLIMKIHVIKLAGGSATFSDYGARWVFRLIDIYFSLGGIALILIMSSSKGQRIGDIIAHTAVVKSEPKMNIDLQDLLMIHKSDTYAPKYQQAKKLQEQDALLIKATLERHRRFHNDSHDEAIDLLCKRIQDILAIDHVAEERVAFLQIILKDYVLLSR